MIILGELIAMITNSFVKVSFMKITDWVSSFSAVYFCRNSCQDDRRKCESNSFQSTAAKQGEFYLLRKHLSEKEPSLLTI